MSINSQFSELKSQLSSSEKMPILFLGHGSPMNAIEENIYSKNWKELGKNLPKPQAILVISAHWMSHGTTLVNLSARPRTIHDFGQFPGKLFQQKYPARGAPEHAEKVLSLLNEHHVQGDDTWGLDHGAWSVLSSLYPKADVPVFQMSIDMSRGAELQFEIGRKIAELRYRGVLILGSGNIVHNLSKIDLSGKVADWAAEFDSKFADLLEARNFDALVNPQNFGSLFKEAHPTVDHYLPTLTVAGGAGENDELLFMNTSIDLGSISMRSFLFH